MIDTIDETKEFLKKDDYRLVDNRTWDEHIGKEGGYSYHKLKGRIEGAVYGYAGKTDSNSMDYYRNANKTMRNGYEILSMWKDDCKIDLNNHLAFMCGSGWRAAETYWDAMVMGLDNTSLYSDGWIAWSNEGNPYVTGDPTK
ncbi:Thiosulfate sulfurtransferase YnjE [bioreactor metagenome]|uniref:Thiosulfate sulfurtransferase YnjE n=1 Tax=bioreactor metagenome TaxID=1076179 RepID=A0A645J103_9ZZZZ